MSQALAAAAAAVAASVPKLNFECESGWLQAPSWLNQSGLDSDARFVWMRLWNLYQIQGKVFVKASTLASDLSLSVKVVRKALAILEDEALITKEEQVGGPNRYFLAADHPLYHPVVYSENPTPKGRGGYPKRDKVPYPKRDRDPTPNGIRTLPQTGYYKKESLRRTLEEEFSEKEQLSAGELRSPLEARSLRSQADRLTPDCSPFFGDFSPSVTDAAAGFQVPTAAPAYCSTAEAIERLAQLKGAAERAKEKNRAEQEAKAQKRARRAQALRNLQGGTSSLPPGTATSLKRLEARWRDEYKSKFPDALLASQWEGKERGQVRGLLKKYSEEDVARAITYYVRYYDKHRTRFFKGGTVLPTLGQIVALHASIVPEAKLLLHAVEVQQRYQTWLKDNEMSLMPTPPELQAEYDAVKPALKSIGML